MARIRIRNWRKFQHYKDRRPDWIKLHAQLLDNLDFRRLSDSGKGVLVSLWLLAARLHDETDTDAELPGDAQYLSDLTGCKITDGALAMLIEAGFLETDGQFEAKPSPAVSKSAQGAEQSGDDGFAEFWKHYPRKVAKGEAQKAWKQTAPKRPELPSVLASLARMKASRQWTKDNGEFIPHAATWLRREGWSDTEPVAASNSGTIPAQTDDARRARLERIGQEDAA